MEKKKGLSLQTILTIAGLALVYLLAFLLDLHSGRAPSCSRPVLLQGRQFTPSWRYP